MCAETLGLAQSSHVYRNPGFSTEYRNPGFSGALMCIETLGLAHSIFLISKSSGKNELSDLVSR